MRAILRSTTAVVALACCVAAARAEDRMPWQPNLEAAQRLAAQTNRLVLIHFWAPWCRPCLRLEREVFSKPETAKGLEANFVLVKLNADDSPGTARMYGVSSLPSDVITLPNGRLVSQLQSPPTSSQYVQMMNRAAEGHRTLARRQSDASAAVPTPNPNAAQAPPAGSTAPTQPNPAPAAAGTASTAPPAGDPYAEYYPPEQHAAPNTGGVMPAQAYSAVPNSPPAQGAPLADPYAQTAGNPPADPYDAPPVQPQAGPYTAAAQTPAQPPANPYAQGASPPAAAPPANPYAAQAAAPPAAAPPANPYAAQAAPAAANPYSQPPANPYSQPAANPHAAQTPPPAAGPANPYTSPSATVNQAATAAYQPPANVPPLPPGCPPVALEGNCPVTLVERKRWAVGHPSFGAVHRGRTYLFLGPQERDKFLAEPDRFSPVLSGLDPVHAIDNQQQVPGKREYGVFGADGKIYLFADESTRSRFEQNEQHYTAAASQQQQPPTYQAMRPGM